ncbi:MAG: phosphate acyltransferase PlsX [Rikenellaceae bacterium]
MRIGVDAMGGDYAPSAVVLGAISASKELINGSVIVLFGNEKQIMDEFNKNGGKPHNIEIINTSQVIEMGESPAQAFTQKPDSSIVVGFTHLKMGKIDGFASAGSTGAMMAGCMLASKQIDGVLRPAIGTLLSTINSGKVMLLDIGLNVDCKPEVLAQYGLIGSIYCKQILGIKSPRVALLNIGEEPEKGNAQSKAAHILMNEQKDKYNFVGNVEPKYLFTGGMADVFVCDGYVGNIILKLCEGIFSVVGDSVKHDGVLSGFNYEREGGTPVLGVNNCVIIGHGCSTPLAIQNMILQVERSVKSSLVSTIKEAFIEK